MFFEGYIPPLAEMISSPRPRTPLFPCLHSPSWVFRVAIALESSPGARTIIRPLCVIPVVLLTHSSLFSRLFTIFHQSDFSLQLFLWNAVSSLQYVTDVLHALSLRFTVQGVYETSTSSCRCDRPSIVDDRSSRSPSVKLEHLFKMPSSVYVCVGGCKTRDAWDLRQNVNGHSRLCPAIFGSVSCLVSMIEADFLCLCSPHDWCMKGRSRKKSSFRKSPHVWIDGMCCRKTRAI